MQDVVNVYLFSLILLMTLVKNFILSENTEISIWKSAQDLLWARK